MQDSNENNLQILYLFFFLDINKEIKYQSLMTICNNMNVFTFIVNPEVHMKSLLRKLTNFWLTEIRMIRHQKALSRFIFVLSFSQQLLLPVLGGCILQDSSLISLFLIILIVTMFLVILSILWHSDKVFSPLSWSSATTRLCTQLPWEL